MLSFSDHKTAIQPNSPKSICITCFELLTTLLGHVSCFHCHTIACTQRSVRCIFYSVTQKIFRIVSRAIALSEWLIHAELKRPKTSATRALYIYIYQFLNLHQTRILHPCKEAFSLTILHQIYMLAFCWICISFHQFAKLSSNFECEPSFKHHRIHPLW